MEDNEEKLPPPAGSSSPPVGLRLILIASLCLFLLATVSEIERRPVTPQPLPPPTESSALDNLIVPGTRVGPLTLGLPISQVAELLGPAQLRPHKDGLVHLYETQGLALFSEKDRVVSVTVRSPAYQTRGGVRVGSDVDEVLQTLGQNYEMNGNQKTYVLHNWGEGWHVGVEDHKVTYIQITVKLDEPPR